MPVALSDKENNLTNLQIELLKSLRYTVSDKQLHEIKSLLRLYFIEELDKAIDKTETERNYTAEVYESWLNEKKSGHTGNTSA
ncbi:MAG: hypothetical protein K2X48_11575 [Chitinophagaceae bacterium]|nr:hypothetical protein [Chitinophagaceae bacterium]